MLAPQAFDKTALYLYRMITDLPPSTAERIFGPRGGAEITEVAQAI